MKRRTILCLLVFGILSWAPIPSARAISSPLPVKGTAGIMTPLLDIGTTTTALPPTNASIAWGDGSSSSALLDCRSGSVSCTWYGQHKYPSSPAPHTYTVTATWGAFSQHSFTTTAQISPIGNFLIVSIGDSVASGEGNPDVPALVNGIYSHRAYWDDANCDASSWAAPALAARDIQETNPATRVTFIHLACSGATIDATSSGQRVAGYAVGQLGELEAMLPAGHKIDALLITVGADDVDGGFGTILNTCLGPYGIGSYTNPVYPNQTTPDPSLDCSTSTNEPSTKLRNDLASIGGSSPSYPDGYPNYAPIQAKIANDNLNVSDIYVTDYYDETHDQSGKFPDLTESRLCTGDLMLPNEWQYLYYDFLLPLNQRVKDVAGQFGWHYVGGADFPIMSDFTDHGYCVGYPGQPAGTSWVVSAPESLMLQEDSGGTGHPNFIGQATYEKYLVNAINKWTPPITTATATTGGQPYVFGTFTTHDVTVTLSAINKLATAGKGATYYSVDDPACSGADTGACSVYHSPFVISTSGRHTIYFFSANASGTFEHVNTEEVLVDNEPPVMTCSATPPTLWPPNNKMVPVTIDVTAVSAAFGPTPFSLESDSTSQGSSTTDIQGFVVGQPSTEGSLLASRLGYVRSGRIYTFVYQSSDPLGLTSTCTVEVPVMHDRRRSNRSSASSSRTLRRLLRVNRRRH